MPTTSLQTFHGFMRLPLELQNHVFEYAFAAEDRQGGRGQLKYFSWTAGKPCFSLVHPRYPSIKMGNWWFSAKRQTGRGVIAVFRLFRMFGFESWRQMIRAAPTSTNKANGSSESKKKRILKIMDGLVEEVKGKLEG